MAIRRTPKLTGLTYGEVELAESDPEWPHEFERLAAALMAALGDGAVAVEHVGSTAVPGLVAKPIVDIAVGLADDVDADRVVGKLESAGYGFRGDAGSEGGLVFVLETQPLHRIAHVHVVRHGDEQWERYLRFRDRLRRDGDAKAGYGNLKRRLAEQFTDDRRAYTAAKASFIAALLDQ